MHLGYDISTYLYLLNIIINIDGIEKTFRKSSKNCKKLILCNGRNMTGDFHIRDGFEKM